MSAVKAWSFSAYDLWAGCPLKYKYEKIDKLDKGPDPEAFKRGRLVHDAIAKYLSKEADSLPTGYVKSKWAMQVYDEFRTFDDIIVEQQWGFTRQWKQTGWFGGPKGETWLRTIVDAGVMYEDMSCEIIDHKTGKPRGSYGDQLELFAVSTFCRIPAAISVDTRLVFTDHDSQPDEKFDAKDKDKLIAKWEKKVAPMLSDENFNPRPGDVCKFCHFSKSADGPCRFG